MCYQVPISQSVQNIDDLLSRFTVPDTNDFQYEPGYRLGYVSNDKNYINNHLKFVLKYHKDEERNTFRVVGFLIEPQSIDKSGLEIKGSAEFFKICMKECVLQVTAVRSILTGHRKSL